MRERPLELRSRFAVFLMVGAMVGTFLIHPAYGQSSGDHRRVGNVISKQNLARIREAVTIQKRHTRHLMSLSGVRATGTGLAGDGQPVIKVLVSRTGIAGIPPDLDGIPVQVQVTEPYFAYADPAPTERWPRPVPIGISTGHPYITAGTIGARVTDGAAVYALSNNHVYAAVNTAGIGDAVIQPGSFDGGTTASDVIGTLFDYEPIQFCQILWIWLICSQTNTIDAALAEVTSSSGGPDLLPSTPSDGYGTPAATLHPAYGDPEVIDDPAEDITQLLGLNVQKYGRTTALTTGTIDAINATVNVCYDQSCTKVAQFVDQIIIVPGTFSAGGDSGSLIVTNDDDKQPVALLFAGSGTQTIANRIDRVLTTFDVRMDSEPLPELTGLKVVPDSSTIKVGQNQQFSAMGIYADSSTADLTSDVTWQSLNPAVATINSQGLATAAATGTTTITASLDDNLHDEAALEVIEATVTLDTITVYPDNADIIPGAILQFTATATYSDGGTADITALVTWTSSNEDVATIGASGLATGIADGETTISAAHDPGTNEPIIGQTQLRVATAVSGGPYLQTGKIWAGTSSWTTVNLDHDYGEKMVVVCTPNYDDSPYGDAKMPVVAHVRNARGTGFEIRAVQAVGGAFEISQAEIHWMVVEEGVYNTADHGVKMEAVKFESTLTDRSGSWSGTAMSYSQPYTNPVVVGQVMSLNSYDAFLGFDLWSVFWCSFSGIAVGGQAFRRRSPHPRRRNHRIRRHRGGFRPHRFG